MGQTFRDVTIFPPGLANFLNVASFGAVDGRGDLVKLGPMLISSRAHRWYQRSVAPVQVSEKLDSCIWVGTFYCHFGHFITETLPRLLSIRRALDANPQARILGFASPGLGGSDRPFPDHVTWFCQKLGIDLSRLDILHTPALVAHLTIPPVPFSARFSYAPPLRDLILQSGLPNMRTTNERLFLTRRNLSANATRIHNIAEIEDLYSKAGYTILAPENLPLEEQIARITGAKVISGENGSALHWSLFAPEMTEVQSLGWDLALQKGICNLWGQTYSPLKSAIFGRIKGRRQTVPTGVVKRHLDRSVAQH